MGDDLILELEDEEDLVLENDVPYSPAGTGDYNELENLPTLNGVTFIGDKGLGDYVPEYIIIDGGDADGYNES